MARVRAATAGGFPVGGPVQDPAATALGQEPRSLIIPNQQPGAAEEIGLGYVALPGRLAGGIGIRVDGGATVSLDIAKLEQGDDTGTPDRWWVPMWNEGAAREQVRRVPVAAIPADAPADGQQWARQDHDWQVVVAPGATWDSITGKPSTFPPTLPIPQSGITDLETDLTDHDNRIAAVESVNADQNTEIAGKEPIIAPGTTGQFWRGDKTWQPVTVNWNAITGVPATFPPAAHTHPVAQIPDFNEGVDDRVAVLLREGTNIDLTYDDTAGTLTIASTAAGGGGIPEAPTDGQLYSRRGSDASWQVSPSGGGGGTAATTTFAPTAAIAATNVQAAIEEVTAEYLPLVGGTVTGKTTFSSTAAASASINIAARSNNPSSPANGDIWINQSSFYFRNQSTTRELATRGGNIFTGNQVLPAGTTSQTPMTLPPGVAPTSPVNGDLWTETNDIKIRLNGVTQSLLGTFNGGTITGDLTINKATPVLIVDKTATTGQSAGLYGRTNGLNRWGIELGSGLAESGSNAGSDFAINSYSDAGAYLNTPFAISRASGFPYFFNDTAFSIGQDVNVRTLRYNSNFFWSWNRSSGDLLWVKVATTAWWIRASDMAMICGGPAYKPGGGPFTDSSDARIKQNVTPYTRGLDAILALNPVTYNFKPETGRDTSTLYHGLIAQEAETPMPEMVSQSDQPVGELQYDDMRILDTAPLIYALVNAVKTLEARVRELEAR